MQKSASEQHGWLSASLFFLRGQPRECHAKDLTTSDKKCNVFVEQQKGEGSWWAIIGCFAQTQEMERCYAY